MKKCSLKIAGLVTVWPKGQIVIPKDIRDAMQVETGTQLVLVIKDGEHLGLIKNENIEELKKYIESEQKHIS